MVDVYDKAKRSEIMSRVKNKRTSPEEAVGEILRGLGIKYRRNDKTLPGKPDFSVRPRKVAIFVNGCFWHGHEHCPRAKLPTTNVDFWTKKIRTNMGRDRRSARKLRLAGWRVITVWQCSLRRPARVRGRLRRLLCIAPDDANSS